MTETATEMVPLFGQHYSVIRRILAWSTLALSATFALSVLTGAYTGSPWNSFTTVVMAGLITVLVAYYLARWQLNGLRWLMYAEAVVVVSVIAVFMVKFFLNGSTSGLSEVASIVGMAIVVLGGAFSFLRRSEKRSSAPTKGI